MSGRFAIVTDSTADMGPLAAEAGVSVVPLTIRFGNEEFRDGIDLTSEQFYAMLATSPQPPITAQPTPAAFEAEYRRILNEGAAEHVLSLHVSSALSGTFNSASLAASAVDPARISVVDTRSVSAGIAMLAIEARARFESGASPAEVLEALQADIPRVELFATIPNLTYLARGGRIGGLRGLLGNVLKIVPILKVEDGAVAEQAKVRTFTRAVDQLVETAIAHIPVKGSARVAILHSVAPDLAKSVGERMRAAVAPSSLITCEIGPTVGTHAGPGAVGVCFIP
ncbi:MAG TPA: DegV family protein [Candidatus Eremiobacteraceae bacterium]|nr:DegV family protein [Candidatus Eremiobacteraceae bacterium]